ncbi:Scramblase-domain-containing protein [Naematelia encephala]|uniref:Scramblase-domain-containing protein n=1 Tax=Naematelia encephala TaxID=71784 RepID=A0A1Y2BIW4_9TREE|nr:Scramblase-domain-containing protein [Naematelia encephala]
MIRRGIVNAAASSSRLPIAARSIATVPPLYRQQPERLPRGHVRPTRRTRSGPLQDTYPTPPEYDIPDAVPSLSRPVIIPNDPKGVLTNNHQARELLGHESLVIARQIEMLNIFVGFEQANRYAIHTPSGELVGFLAEEEQSIISTMSRQLLRTHRPFRAVVMDKLGNPVLWIKRPFAFINSRIYVHASQEETGSLIGEAQQEWHPWRRRYNVFQARDEDTFSQFARIDSGLWAWDFWLKDRDDRLVASINRNFRGLGRELFTDTGQYVIRFDSAGTELDLPPGSDLSVQGQTLVLPEGKEGALTLDQRAMALATAISIDFDYFSRHSGAGGMGFPFFMWGGGDGSSDVNSGRGNPEGGAAAGAGVGAASAGLDRPLTEDEQVYGPQPTRSSEDVPAYGDEYPEPPPKEGMEGYDEDFDDDAEEIMDDPWESTDGDDSGWFGGGGGGGDWGDWGQ